MHRFGSGRSTPLDRWALKALQRASVSLPCRFVLWDGFEDPASLPPVATIRINNRRALYSVLWNADLYFGEGYMSGGIEIDGELLAALEAVYRASPIPSKRRWWRAASNGLSSARDNVHRHYDLGNDFYRLWLDREMLYTCAYFPRSESMLEEAQIAKMDLICRKVQLRSGERVLEAGCGWGALALFMARQYGASVRAFNLSAEQVAYARQRAKDEHLDHLVDFVEDDYRRASGSYDLFISVGMLEHVGPHDFPTLGRVIARSLTPNGRGLLHFIGRNHPMPLNPWIRKRIFPGAYPPTLAEVCSEILSPNGFSVLDVENLRLHYAETLAHWRRRFEAASREIAGMFDETFVRAWQLYLVGSQAAFTTGWMQLFQVVYARSTSNAVRWTRMGTETPWASNIARS